MRLIYGCLLWVVGTLVCAALGLSTGFCLVVLTGCVLLSFVLKNPQRGAALCCAILAAGMLRYALEPIGPDETDIATYNGTRNAIIEGLVCEEPDRRSTRFQLVLSVERVEIDGEWQSVSGYALLSAPIYPRFEYGDRLSISGSIEEPPEEGDFSYKDYLADRKIYSLISGDITLMKEQSSFYRWLLGIKQALRSTVERLLPDPESGLLVGILLGQDHTLPDYLQEAYRSTGLSHIIVISGFNISLIAQAMMMASSRLGKQLGLWVSLATILLFALFVGWSPPVTRAAIMGALTIIAQLSGRKSHTPTSLAAATLLMMLISPRILWNVSFQLSFAASAGLIFIEPAIANRLALQGNAFSTFRDLVLSTLVAQLMTLPIAWYHFGELSLIALPANILVLWAQPAILILGGCMTLLGMFWLPLGQLGAALVWPLLRYTNQVVEALATPSWSLITLPQASLWWILGIYALIGLFIWRRQRQPHDESTNSGLRLPNWVAMLGLTALALVAITSRLPDGSTHIYFFDVGQGDAALVVSPGGRTILIDGGADPALLAARIGETLPYWQRNIDCVLATHADGDHLTGLVPLAERYDIGLAIESPVMGETALVERWHEALEGRETPIVQAHRGQELEIGDSLHLSILHPSLTEARGDLDENRYSIVAQLDAGVSTLFTADIDMTAESILLAGCDTLDADILKVSHHGAGTASGEAFLDVVSPELAIISVGFDNRYGHPSQECLARLVEAGIDIRRTDLEGTIEIVIPSVESDTSSL